MDKNSKIRREQARQHDRMDALSMAAYMLGVNTSGQARAKRLAMTEVFSEADLPGICRTCVYSVARHSGMPGVGQPELYCDVRHDLRRIPLGYTRCSTYAPRAVKDENAVVLDQAFLDQAILLPSVWATGKREQWPWTEARQDNEDVEAMAKKAEEGEKKGEREPGSNYK